MIIYDTLIKKSFPISRIGKLVERTLIQEAS